MKMGRVLILLWMLILCAHNIFAGEEVYGNKQAFVSTLNHSKPETSGKHFSFITVFAERFAKNQEQIPECMINSSIDEFPDDVFTNQQRLSGAVILHILGAIYFFTLLAVVCNDYFLPSVECICNGLNISKDVAAATFMATATTTPEFFTNAISTFIMDSDMGLGTIIGSLMFNTLGVAALAGLASVHKVKLEWWPITRDSILYSMNLLVLVWFSWDSIITLYESIVLVILYFIYFVILFQNNRIMNFFVGLFTRKRCSHNDQPTTPSPPPPLSQSNTLPLNYDMNSNSLPNPDKSIYHIYDKPNCAYVNEVDDLMKDEDDTKARKSLWTLPKGKLLKKFWWVYTWPIKFILTLTIPNPKTYKKLYPLTFFLCIIWIGINSYLIVWMMTVVGYTFAIPESVMGITLLAAGGCMPEAISSVLMIRKGEGGIGVSNSLGANSLAILMSLGVPWLIRNIVYHNTADKSFIVISSYGIEYTITLLLVATVVLYGVLAIAKYHLSKRVGLSLFAVYSIFLTIGVLMELDVIFPISHCP